MSMEHIDAAALATQVAKLEAKVAYLDDRLQIHDVYRRYTRGFDRSDVELMHTAFWPDVQINYGTQLLSFDGFVTEHLDMHTRELASYAHHIASESVEIDGDVAHVECYVVAFFRQREGSDFAGGTNIAGGRYIDRLDRRDGEWRIAVRDFIPHFFVKTESTFESVILDDRWPESDRARGSWDRGDLSYVRPLEPRPAGGDADAVAP